MSELKGKTVAIVALGGSAHDFVMDRVNSTHYDEIWGINSVGAIFRVDRTFMMDPVSRFLDSGLAGNQTGVAREFLLQTPDKGPIYSCCLDERVPEVILYPLQEVIQETKFSYFNNTVAYAVAFAVYSQVGKIHFYGVDFTYKQNIHFAEAGRGCVEFWCGVAVSKGIEISVAARSGLMDNNVPIEEKLYGYHRLDNPLVQTVIDGTLNIMPKSDYDALGIKQKEVTPPEPKDGVLIGRHDIKGVTYND